MDDTESILEQHIREKIFHWERGRVTLEERANRAKNMGKLIILHGVYGSGKRRVAKALEKHLFDAGYNTYYFGISNYFEELDHDVRMRDKGREEHLERLGDLARVMTDAGSLLITTVTDADDYDMERLKMLNEPNDIFVVNLGENNFTNYPVDVLLDYRPEMDQAIETIVAMLRKQGVLLD